MDVDLNGKCRGCLSEGQPMMSLFEEYEHNITLANILQLFVTTKIEEDDGLPTHICDNCTLTLTKFYNFTVIFEESRKHLEEFINENKSNEIQLNSTSSNYEPIYAKSDLDQIELVETNEDKFVVLEVENSINLTNLNEETDYNFEQTIEEDVGIKIEVPVVQSQTKVKRPSPRFVQKDNETFEEIIKYECNLCGDVHLFEQNFQHHMKIKHSLSQIDSSKYSQTVLLKVPGLRSDPQAEFECSICKKVLGSPQVLQQHMKLHDAVKKYICDICGTRFSRKTYLVDHLEGHSNDKKHKCKFCGKAFRRRTVLRTHSRVHTHPNFHVCELCGRGFTNLSTLKTHHHLIHVRERNFQCMICGVRFSLKSTLTKHVLRHQKRENGEKGFDCIHCTMQYRDKSSLKRHIETKHLGKLQLAFCPDCPKVYTSKTNLTKHRRKYHTSSNVTILS